MALEMGTIIYKAKPEGIVQKQMIWFKWLCITFVLFFLLKAMETKLMALSSVFMEESRTSKPSLGEERLMTSLGTMCHNILKNGGQCSIITCIHSVLDIMATVEDTQHK